MPCLGETRAKVYTLVGTERTKTIPCPAAHVWIGHIREFPPPGVECTFFKTKKFHLNLDNNSLTTYTKTRFLLPGLQNILCF